MFCLGFQGFRGVQQQLEAALQLQFPAASQKSYQITESFAERTACGTTFGTSGTGW